MSDDILGMMSGEVSVDAPKEKSISSHVCEEAEIVGNAEGIIIPWALVKTLLGHGETTKSGKEVKAYITIPRGGIKMGEKLLNKVRMGVGVYLKP